MRIDIGTYLSGDSPLHACDARVKVLLLAAYSVTLFLVDTWLGLALSALAFVVAFGVSGLPPWRVLSLMIPVYVLVAFTIVFNSFAFGVGEGASVALAGTLCFVPAGLARGCFFAVRILLLVAASLVVGFTTTSTALTSAFADFLGPLRRLRVPVDDIAMVFSLALRFIPVTAEELGRVHDAQWARGANFGTGSMWQRLRAWQAVLIPLFVDMFRRADVLACAMDARCYGAPGVRRTSLACRRFRPTSALALACGLAACVALAALL